MTYWKPKQKSKIAKLAKIQPHHLSEILHRKRGVGKDNAKALQQASKYVLGYAIPLEEWLFNNTTKHPAFYGEPSE